MGVAQPPRSCCAPCSEMLLACPKAPTLTSPDRENGERQPVTTARSSLRTAPAHRILYSDSRPEGSTSYLTSKSSWRASTRRGRTAKRGGPSGCAMRGRRFLCSRRQRGPSGSQNGFEAGNELPPSPTAAEVTSEETDPALKSDSLAAGVTQPEGAAPASKDDSRVRGQAEPGGAASYVTVENTLMAEQGDATVAGPLPPPLSQPSTTPAAVRGTAEGTGPARESDPTAAGVAPPEGQL